MAVKHPATAPGNRSASLSCHSTRLRLAGGAETTLHVARFDRVRTVARVVALDPPAQLLSWCVGAGVADAMVGGFFVRPDGTPLGELRIGGDPREHVPFDPPWGERRTCIQIVDGSPSLAPRDELAGEPDGDLLQAGPMLVRRAEPSVAPGVDPEGFSAGAAQFDSDITDGRYPRAALGLNDDEVIAVVCDGRGERDHGLAMDEMACTMADLGASTAINLDGGGSASLVIGGRLRNHPREKHGIDLLGGRVVSTALVFEGRAASQP